ncbi:MAG: hypothetical protein EA379_08905 [Phycisphaerales bacterium]|nr:MAG: hypothetical protein EA379_08905 [Phycisphaerales bacterium]
MPSKADQQLDLLVVGLARSGTTMFTNLLTNPDKRRLCLAEPRLTTRRAYRESKKQYFRHVGAQEPITPESLAAFLFAHDRAGVKEIRSHHVRGAMRRYDPKRIALAVRDARASLVSYYEKHQNRNKTQWRLRKPFPAKLFLRTAPMMLDLLEAEKDRVVVVRYEPFVKEPAYREEIAKAIDWPLDGDLGIFDSMSRKHDSGKHGKKVTTRSLSRATPTDPEVLQVLTPVLERLADFQRAFGYPTQWDPPQDAAPADAAPVASDGRG